MDVKTREDLKIFYSHITTLSLSLPLSLSPLSLFPIGLHVILELQIKKNQKLIESDAQNYFNRKSVLK